MTGQNLAFVSAAYAATWVMMVGYWIHVHRTLGRARRALTQATEQAKRPEGKP